MIEPSVMLEINRATDFKKATRNLMKALFSHQELVFSSVTGKKSSKKTEAMQPLDAKKVALITGMHKMCGIHYSKVSNSNRQTRLFVTKNISYKLNNCYIMPIKLVKEFYQISVIKLQYLAV